MQPFFLFQAEVYVNLLEEDNEEFDDVQMDEFGDSEVDPNITKDNIDVSAEKCFIDKSQFGEFQDQNINNDMTHRNIQKRFLQQEHGIDMDDLNDDLVAKLLDPFEQLEREFNWDNVAAINPPSAFSSGQKHSKSIEVNEKASAPLKLGSITVFQKSNPLVDFKR